MIVIGAGMAGLLAAGMLQQKCSAVHERGVQLPNSHSAVLRFRSSIVADTLNIPFKKVQVLKAVDPWRNAVADAMAYSVKTNGAGTLRSIVSANGQLSERYIAPEDLVQQMRERVSSDIIFDSEVEPEDLHQWFQQREPVISTMPMPELMRLTGWAPRSQFRYQPGRNVVADLVGVDAYCSVYTPNPEHPTYRVSITGDKLIAELSRKAVQQNFGRNDVLHYALQAVGLSAEHVLHAEIKDQPYAKILPIDEQERRRFILYATEQFGIYSLGRFATWRPGLLLDDVVHDVRVIQRLAAGESHYDHVKGE